jgi:hypothetical protein
MKFIIIYIFLLSSILATAQTSVDWSDPVTIAQTSFGNYHPRISLDANGNPLIIWGNSGNNVYFSKMNGNRFTAPVALNPANIQVFTASWAGPDIATHGDTVYVVIKQTPENTNHIYLVHSFDAGKTFSKPVAVDDIADSISRFPAVTTDDNGNPLVAFMKFNSDFSKARYVVSKSNNFGGTFSKDVLASMFSGGEVCSCCPATVLSSGNNSIMLYRDQKANIRDIWAGISDNDGSSFSKGKEVDDTKWFINSCPASGPDGVIIGDTVYSVFMSAGSGKNLCYLSKMSISNPQSETTYPVTGNFMRLAMQNYPRIANYGKSVAIAWVQNVNGQTQVAFSFTDDITKGFNPGFETEAIGSISNADVAVSKNSVYIVSEDDNSGNVKYRKGTYTIESVNETKQYEFRFHIFPNPVINDLLILKFDNVTSEKIEYTINDIFGQNILNNFVNANNDIKIDLSGFCSGTYFIRVKAGNNTLISKFIKL